MKKKCIRLLLLTVIWLFNFTKMFSYTALSILLSTKLLYIAIWPTIIFQKFWWHCSLKTWWIKWKCSITTKDTLLRHFKLFLKVRMLWLITYWQFESIYFLIKYTTSSSFLHFIGDGHFSIFHFSVNSWWCDTNFL